MWISSLRLWNRFAVDTFSRGIHGAADPNSLATLRQLKPEDFGRTEIGHFASFHSHFRDTFWAGTIRWLR